MNKLIYSLVVALAMGMPSAAIGANNPANIPTVTNVAALKALGPAAALYPTVQVLGYTTAGDGGGMLVTWSGSSTATPNLCGPFQATGVTTGRFIRVSNQPVDVRSCGAVEDSATDSTAAISAAVATGLTVNVPILSGFCFLSSGGTSVTTAGQHIIGGGCIKMTSASANVFTVNQVDDVVFDVELDGNRGSLGTNLPVRGIRCIRSSRMKIYGNYHDFPDDGIQVWNCPSLYVDQSTYVHDNYNIGIEIKCYAYDPLAGPGPWVGDPRYCSGWIYGRYERNNDAGAGNGTGVDFSESNNSSGAAPAIPIHDMTVGGTYIDNVRGIWTENNDLGGEAYNIVFDHPVINNDVSPGYTSYYGIGIIGAKNVQVIGPVGHNIATADDTGVNTALISLSAAIGTTQNDGISIVSPVLLEDSGLSNRVEYGIHIDVSTNIQVTGDYMTGFRTAEYSVNATHVTNFWRTNLSSYTVSNLNSLFPPATCALGMKSFVSDSNATLAAGIGNTVVGGGANLVPVYCDQSNWKIGG